VAKKYKSITDKVRLCCKVHKGVGVVLITAMEKLLCGI